MKIRKFKYHDLNQVLEIEKDAYGEDHWSRDIFYTELDKKNSYNIVAVKDKTIAGFLISSYLFDEAELLSVAVAKNHRRKGIARKLMENFIHNSKLNGIEKIFLEVKTQNFKAKLLYTSFGFEKISVRKKYYSDGSDADIMLLKL